MASVNMHEAKTNLSKLVETLVSGEENEIILSRNGVPAVRMTAITVAKPRPQFGFAKGRYHFDYDEFQALDAEVQRLMEGDVNPSDERLAG